MKKTIFIIMLSFFAMPVLAENWHFLFKIGEQHPYYGINDEYFVDLDSIRLIDKQNNIREAKVKFTSGFLSLKRSNRRYSISTDQYDCKNKTIKHLLSTNTNKDGSTDKFIDKRNRVEKFAAQSMVDYQWQAVCSAPIKK